jgi:hypothetical protein
VLQLVKVNKIFYLTFIYLKIYIYLKIIFIYFFFQDITGYSPAKTVRKYLKLEHTASTISSVLGYAEKVLEIFLI